MKSNYLALAAATTAICAAPAATRPLAIGDVDNFERRLVSRARPRRQLGRLPSRRRRCQGGQEFQSHLDDLVGRCPHRPAHQPGEGERVDAALEPRRPLPRLHFLAHRQARNDQLWLLDRAGGEAHR